MSQAKKILEDLAVINESAKKLVVDSLFVSCLDEAIEAYWKNTFCNEAKVVFAVHSSGDMLYQGIAENCADSAMITVDINRVVEKKAITEKEILDSANELLHLEIQGKKNKLLDQLLRKS